LISLILRWVWGGCCSSFFMPARSTGSEEDTMFDPILGLVVAIGLSAYLVATLLMPERF
jgi:K+-transporting ATPase KdpF subunit